jgi:hypothetical protein
MFIIHPYLPVIKRDSTIGVSFLINLVETLLTTWNQIKRELIVASEIYQSMRITYLIEAK